MAPVVETDPTSSSKGFRRSPRWCRISAASPRTRSDRWRSSRGRGRVTASTRSGARTTLEPGPVPRAEPDDRDARLHQDQRPDSQPRTADARHQPVRHHLHAADLGDEQRHRPAHRARDLGECARHQQPGRADDRRADGLDPARHGDPRSGRDAVPERGSSPHPGQQHHPVRDRRQSSAQLTVRAGRAGVPGAQPLP